MKLKVTKDLCEIKQNEIWNVGDYNVHTVQVELSPEFNGLVNKVRYFIEDNSYDMLITDNVAQVPYEATVTEGTIKIGVYGYDADTDILVQSTSPVNKYITSGTYTGEPDNTEPLTPTDKQQMESAIQQNTDDIIVLQNNKQDVLISGENIKTINNESILGSGNIEIGGGSGGTSDYTDLTNKPKINNVELNGNKTSSDLGLQPAGNYALESEIPDVSNFVTNTVDNLVNYYKKSETFTKQEVNNLISAITTIDIQVVQTLPTQDISTTTIYLVPKTTTEQNDAYDEYIYVSNAWEHIGSTDIDLSGYQTKIDSTHKLSSDLVDDTNQTNLFVTSAEKTTWNNKLDQSDLTDYVKNTDYASESVAGVIKPFGDYATAVNQNGRLYARVDTYSDYNNRPNTSFISKGTLENVITGKGLIDSSYHDSTKQDVIDNTLTTINKTIPTAINEVNSIAKGANQALSYGNYQTMITAFNSLANNVYNVGQNVMIITLQVPDLWISGIESTSQTYTYTTDEAITTALSTNGYIQVGYYKLSALETQKVDLTDYEQNTNKTTTISSSSTNTEYPSAKAVYDYIQSLNGDEVNY